MAKLASTIPLSINKVHMNRQCTFSLRCSRWVSEEMFFLLFVFPYAVCFSVGCRSRGLWVFFFLSEREGVKLAYICFWFVSIVKFLAEKISFFIVSPIIIIG